MNVKYLSIKQILKLHKDLIGHFGGALGIRDQKLLESAIYRCQQSFDGKDLYPDIFTKAAALLESFCGNHPFIDGNKRIAFLVAAVFLDINGYKTSFSVEEAERFILAFASGDKQFEEIVVFLKKSVKKR